MDVVNTVFGSGRDLDALQMAARAAVIFVCALVLMRISGRRSFGQRSPFDYVIAILLGATLSRVIVGASPALPTAGASLVLVLLHRVLAWACVHSRQLERIVGGVERELYRDGRFDEQQMSAALITKTDIMESVRRQLGALDLSKVKIVLLERNGEISLIRDATEK
jgi:uncharacterized membrane protein YcaP (DUF421 family)